MQTISMLELRHHAQETVRRVQRGQSLVLTYRGEPVARLEPYAPVSCAAADSFYRLAEIADPSGEGMANCEMDELIYGG